MTTFLYCAVVLAGAYYLTDLLFRVIDQVERPRRGGADK